MLLEPGRCGAPSREDGARGVRFALATHNTSLESKREFAPFALDVVWACREALHEAGIFPIPRFTPDLAENHAKPEIALPLAA